MTNSLRFLLTLIGVSGIMFACLIRPTEMSIMMATLTRLVAVSAAAIVVLRDWPAPNRVLLGFVVASLLTFMASSQSPYADLWYFNTFNVLLGNHPFFNLSNSYEEYSRVATQAFHLLFCLVFGVASACLIPWRARSVARESGPEKLENNDRSS